MRISIARYRKKKKDSNKNKIVPKNWTDRNVKYNYKMRNGKDPQRSKAKANR